ncbi:hypothetical protein [Mucilaginibacter sp. CSA2-8R]|uniref:hypothetical protein n=1 Tax=Mucilaginibacter sp. CSA2-8R TaxID=3141542 RepID=UPI00315CBB2F
MNQQSTSSDILSAKTIMALLVNTVAIIFLGMPFLAAPAVDTPYWRILLGLMAYVGIIVGLASLVTTLLLHKTYKRLGYLKRTVTLAQFLIMIVG